jgi:uncharacterized repeat protein (TIGR01451 family)
MKKLKLIVCLVFWAFWANAQSVTYNVTNGNASGAGSFQEAVNQMNALSSPTNVTVQFNGSFYLNSLFEISNNNIISFNGDFINSTISVIKLNSDFNNKNIHISNLKATFFLSYSISLNGPNFNVLNSDLRFTTNYQGNGPYYSSLNYFNSSNSKIVFDATIFIKDALVLHNCTIHNFGLGEVKSLTLNSCEVRWDYPYTNFILSIGVHNSYINVSRNLSTSFGNPFLNSFDLKASNGGGNHRLAEFINTYFLGINNYGIYCQSGFASVKVENCYFGHPDYPSLSKPKIPIFIEDNTHTKLFLKRNIFYNSETTIVLNAVSPNIITNYDSTNQMINCKNGIVIPNYTNSIAITSVDTSANTIGGTCNCNEVLVWKNGSPLSSNNPTGESFIATVPCTGGNWSYTNTSSTPITQLTFMERFNISNSFLNNKRTGTFTNWQGFDLGANITKCASRGKVLNANIFGSSNHVWNTGATSSTITAYNEGLYKVTFLDLLGNERSDSIFISNDTFVRQVDIGADSTICNGDSVRLVSNVLSGVSYLWNNGKTTSAIYVKTQGWHKLTIKDSCNNISADSIYLTVNQNCGKILGRVFYDADSSCTFNGIDKAYRNILVKANPGNFYTFTDANGNYQFLVPANDYRVEIVTGTDWRVKCPSDTVYNITLPANTIINNRNFSILPIKGSPDLEVHFTNSLMRPLSAGSYHISYKNTGKLGSGNVKFTLPDSVNFGSSSPAASAVSGKTYTYNFTNLFPGETRFITINGNVITNTIGTPLEACAVINPIATDYDSTNNRICKTEIVRGAIDPNDKLVTPTGVSQYGYIERKDSVLTYTIRFQNIGTDTAFNVLITDTLSNQVDFESIRVLEASHGYYMQQTQGGVLRFRFKNIKLPDSTTNQAKSNGFISFRVKLKSNLAHGTEIKNMATIYFDTQAGLATNEVQNTIMHYMPMVNEGNLTKCHDDSVQLTASVAGGSYLWNTGDTTQQIWVSNTGNYHYQFTDSLGFMAVSNVVEISHYPISELILSTNGDTLFATEGFAYYTWYLDGEILTTTTAQNYIIPQIDGDYMVQITENQGACITESETITFIVNRLENRYQRFEKNSLNIYPNPANSHLTISSKQLAKGEKVEIFNAMGVKMLDASIPQHDKSGGSVEIDISSLAKGIYLVKVGNETAKVVVE